NYLSIFKKKIWTLFYSQLSGRWMEDLKKVLVAEDELTNSLLLKRLLTKAGYSVVVAHNGADALKHIERENFDILLTDWMMPQMDGIELIRLTRDKIKPLPYIIMVTALVSESAKNYALESGADDYVAKPIDIDELLSRVKYGLEINEQEIQSTDEHLDTKDASQDPPFSGVVIATSTGGPPTLIKMFKNIDYKQNAAYYVVQHGPPWMLETFSERLQKETSLNIHLVKNNMISQPRQVYIAPGDRHMRIEKGTFKIVLDDGPKENFVRPAADPLFRSAAEAFGKKCIAVILTGLGRDGTHGAATISSLKGQIIVQDPETAVAPSMPKTVIESGINYKLAPLHLLGHTISEAISFVSSQK
ncbi:MAG: chemotaxis protein CheB, partial [Bacteroidota bacterium]